jgi:hypothetical protein
MQCSSRINYYDMKKKKKNETCVIRTRLRPNNKKLADREYCTFGSKEISGVVLTEHISHFPIERANKRKNFSNTN